MAQPLMLFRPGTPAKRVYQVTEGMALRASTGLGTGGIMGELERLAVSEALDDVSGGILDKFEGELEIGVFAIVWVGD